MIVKHALFAVAAAVLLVAVLGVRAFIALPIVLVLTCGAMIGMMASMMVRERRAAAAARPPAERPEAPNRLRP
jgi:hypothetical protein